MSTIYIRSDPIRVVVKPYPRELGGGLNQLELTSKGKARTYARRLKEKHGWLVADELEAQPAERESPIDPFPPDMEEAREARRCRAR